jgi:hypothetical protein
MKSYRPGNGLIEPKFMVIFKKGSIGNFRKKLDFKMLKSNEVENKKK